MAEEEQTLDLTTIGDDGESNVEENVEENNGEEERLAAEAAAKAEEERVAAEENEEKEDIDNVKRDISYLFNIKNGITEMTDEDRDYLLSKFDETRRKIIYSMPNQFGKDMKIKSFINPNYAE